MLIDCRPARVAAALVAVVSCCPLFVNVNVAAVAAARTLAVVVDAFRIVMIIHVQTMKCDIRCYRAQHLLVGALLFI